MKSDFYERYFNAVQFFGYFIIASYENETDDQVLENYFNAFIVESELKEDLKRLKKDLLLIIEYKEKYINDIMNWTNRYFNSSEELGVWLTMIYNKIDEKYKNLET
jgi:hypothetical protein